MNTRRVRWLEDDLLGLFKIIREEIPRCHALSFSISRYNSGDISMNVYYHEGNECCILEGIQPLLSIYRRHQILFQKFEGWGNEANK